VAVVYCGGGGEVPNSQQVSRRAAFLAPLGAAFLAALPAAPAHAFGALGVKNPLEAKASPTSASDAFVAVMDGRDAIAAAMELQGMQEGGRRMRVQNLLPRYADKVRTMTAMLPAAVTASYGEVVVTPAATVATAATAAESSELGGGMGRETRGKHANIALHVIDTQFEASIIELDDIL